MVDEYQKAETFQNYLNWIDKSKITKTENGNTDYSEAGKWEKFKSDASKRAVYLIFEKLYILPGEPIPEKYGPDLAPHYRFITRDELRLMKRAKS